MSNDELLNILLAAFIKERQATRIVSIPTKTVDKWYLLRTLMNVRPPLPVQPEILEIQDQLLSAQREAKGIILIDALPTIREQFPNTRLPFADQLVLWKGDITTLAADAIVNAANAKLLGCFIPHHACIDNVIHTGAGIQLRLECDQIIRAQGHDEPTGQAQITRGYNLPARYILHTIGPIIQHQVSTENQRQLASCYKACLDLAARHEDIQSVAFCCISTGEFRFPKDQAARIAVQTVCDWLEVSKRKPLKVIFNVFTQEDDDIYTHLFRAD